MYYWTRVYQVSHCSPFQGIVHKYHQSRVSLLMVTLQHVIVCPADDHWYVRCGRHFLPIKWFLPLFAKLMVRDAKLLFIGWFYSKWIATTYYHIEKAFFFKNTIYHGNKFWKLTLSHVFCFIDATNVHLLHQTKFWRNDLFTSVTPHMVLVYHLIFVNGIFHHYIFLLHTYSRYHRGGLC